MRNKTIALFICALITMSVYADKTINNAVEKTKSFNEAVTFTGQAVPLVTTTIKYGFNDSYRGIITFTPPKGTIFLGPTYDAKGKQIRKGDVLIQLRTAYREAALKAQKALLLEAEADLQQKQENYERFQTLVKQHSVSTEDYQQARAAYYSSLGEYEVQKANLVEVKTMLELCTYHAQFTGVVDEVFFPTGLCAGELDVMQVSQLFPMGIEVKMPRELANKISISTPVTVYSEFLDKPLGVGHGFTTLTKGGIRFVVDNYPLEFKNGDKEILNVHNVHTVLQVKYLGIKSKNLLSVEKKAVKKDAKGYYVWRAVGQENYVPGKGIDHVFKLEKVRVTPGDDFEKLQPGIEFVSLANPGSLKFKDVTVSDVPKDFKDGGEAYCSIERFLFMPGDPVKVVIGPEK